MQTLSKHPGGRPTKYNKEVLIKTQDYLINYDSYGDVVPTIAGLSQVLDIARETTIQWLNDESKQEFSYMCKRLLTSQESKLVNGGLTSGLNSNIVKLMLSKHGYSDNDKNQGVTVNVVINDKPVTIEVQGETLDDL